MGRVLCWLGLSIVVATLSSALAQGEAERFNSRLKLERQIAENPVAIAPHRQNYLLFGYYDPNRFNDAEQRESLGFSLDHGEIKFQVSIRVPIWRQVMGSRANVYVAYTNQSYWQAFNQHESSPFREINHEPELLVTWFNDFQIGPLRNRALVLGFNHQSNGRSNDAEVSETGELLARSSSRSWNRIIGTAIFEQGDALWRMSAWYRLPEDEKESPEDPKGDDNPDIDDYLGHGELEYQRLFGRMAASLMVRNNLDFDRNRGAVSLELEAPVTDKLNAMVQVFNGYGESLIDYDRNVTRVAVGFTLRAF